MKTKSVQLIIIILIIVIIPIKGQHHEKTSRWSATIGYSPICTFNYSPLVFDKDDLYSKAVSGRITYRLSTRFSILAGVSTRHKKTYLRYDLFPNAYLTKDYLEFPVQINYMIHKSSDTFFPYIKIAIVSSSLHSRVLDGPIPLKESDFNLLTDVGIGASLRIINPLSVICELSTGYSLTYQFRDRAYISGFLGLQYQF